MRILSFTVPPLENNAFLLVDEGSKQAVVVDPAGGAEVLSKAVREQGLTVTAIVNTHGHHDHTADNAPLQAAVGGKIAIHETDAYRLERNTAEPRWYLPVPPPPSKADLILKEGSEIRFGSSGLRVLHTPGHTLGSICLYNPMQGVLFTGDIVMAGRYGRYDGPGGSFAKLLESVRTLLRLPRETKVYPGHGAFTTLAAEAPWMENLRYASAH